jgi:hypothetical protein
MNALQRITLGLFAAGALTSEIEPALRLGSDLYQVPGWLRQLEILRQEEQRLGQQCNALLQVTEARQEVMHRLRLQELTAREGHECFCQLESLRSSSGIPEIGKATNETLRARAYSKLVDWIALERKRYPGAPGDSVLARIEQELQSGAGPKETTSQMH